jgi:hypothetical protein
MTDHAHESGASLPQVLLFPSPHLPTPCGLSHISEMTCASDNTQAVDQSHFWTDGSVHWDAHRVGWAVAGACTAVVRFISLAVDKETSLHLPCITFRLC